MTTFTVGQVMLAAFVGFAGIIAAFAPAIAVGTHYIAKNRQDHDDTSIVTFLVALMGFQFIVSVFFYWALKIFDLLIKVDDMTILGAHGLFSLFWTIPVVQGNATIETWTSLIVMVREFLKMINGLIPIFVLLFGVVVGYWISESKISQHRTTGQIDYLGYGLRIFAGVFIAAVAYIGWSQMASQTLQMPLAGDGSGTIVTLHEAAAAWWREGVGITHTKTK